VALRCRSDLQAVVTQRSAVGPASTAARAGDQQPIWPFNALKTQPDNIFAVLIAHFIGSFMTNPHDTA
jgi:hypothetical protein